MKHRFLAKKYWKDASTPFGTTNEKAAQFDDCINLSIGDPDLITDKIIIDGAYQDALKGHTRYTNMYGDIELRDEIRKFYKDEYDLDIAPDEVIVTTSGLIAMYMALAFFTTWFSNPSTWFYLGATVMAALFVGYRGKKKGEKEDV